MVPCSEFRVPIPTITSTDDLPFLRCQYLSYQTYFTHHTHFLSTESRIPRTQYPSVHYQIISSSHQQIIKSPQEGNTFVNVYDGTGQLIYSQNIGSRRGSNSEDLDLMAPEPGIYYLTIRRNNQSYSKKIVITTN